MAVANLFNKADAHFTSTKKPPRSKNYSDAERPLRRVNEAFIKLVQDAHSYVYKFSGHDVVRVYEPDDNGNIQVCIKPDGYTSTDQYMQKFTGLYNRMLIETNTGEWVRLPLNYFYKKQEKDFAAVLTFTSDGKLIVDQSWHADIYKKQSSKADKDTRKAIKDRVSTLVTLQTFRMPTLRENAKVERYLGTPFTSSRVQPDAYRVVHNTLKSGGSVDEQAFIDAFDVLAQSVFDTLASKRVYEKHGTRGFYSSWVMQQNPNHAQEIAAMHKEAIDGMTTEDIRTVLERKLLSMLNLNEGSEFVALPQFPKSLPTKYYLSNS